MVLAWKQFATWCLYAAIVCLALVVTHERLSILNGVLLLSAGFVSWSLIEYGLHRFIFHYDARSRVGRLVLYHAHISHHETPEAMGKHIASLCLSAPVAAVYWLIAWAATASWRVASLLLLGMAGGFLCYQWVHFQCHHGKSHLRLLRYLKKYHQLHHHQTPEMRFGVTSPLFDLVFGTFRSAQHNPPS